jgi:hypothetical protein
LIYLYAITDQPETPLPTLNGLEEVPLFSLVQSEIAAVVSTITLVNGHSALPPSETNLWRHEAVLESLMKDRTVLPVRYGAMFADESTAMGVLTAHYQSFVHGLDRVRGRVELSLRVLWENEEIKPMKPNYRKAFNNNGCMNSGREYLYSRLNAEHLQQAIHFQAEKLVAELHPVLVRLSVEHYHQILLRPSLLVKAAYLVEQGQELNFRREVERLRQAYPTLRFLCTGPWPPYNFVQE